MTQAIKEFEQSEIFSAFWETDVSQAYIRSLTEGGELLWGIYDETGEKIGHASSREMALAIACQNDLMPFNVH